jgi:hypothetical protein
MDPENNPHLLQEQYAPHDFGMQKWNDRTEFPNEPLEALLG